MTNNLKRIIAVLMICGLLLCDFTPIHAAALLGSKTKYYSNNNGYITILSDVRSSQYGSQYFYKGTLYHKTACNMNVKSSGYYKNMYGTIYHAKSEIVAEKSTNTVSSYVYSSTTDVPVCSSTYKNKAVGYSVGGDIEVTRPAS